ncbi:uncharacterized protein [Pocillopora verrucosa]|uniref:uncharacterized protein n=1 Tax=Pocillopora verrucosa TaxID=203993 RepID=UPI003342500A
MDYMLDLSKLFLRKLRPAVLLQLVEGSKYLKRITNFRKRKRTLFEHWQFIKDYRIVMAQFPAEECMRDIQNGRVYQKFIQHDPCAREKKVLSIVHLEVVLSQNTWFPIGQQKIMSPSTA